MHQQSPSNCSLPESPIRGTPPTSPYTSRSSPSSATYNRARKRLIEVHLQNNNSNSGSPARGSHCSMPSTTTTMSIPVATKAGNGKQQQQQKPVLQDAKLTATILSTYDLPSRDAPTHVRIFLHGSDPSTTAVKSGPPSQRHKDRNSFKFDSSNDGNQVVLRGRLPELYASTATIQLCYDGTDNNNNSNTSSVVPPLPSLTATYPLKQLKLCETTWLILTLDGSELHEAHHASYGGGNATAASSSPAAGASLGLGLGVRYTDDDCPPTLRLQLQLDGPYRTEIGAVVSLGTAWFRFVDQIEEALQQHVLSKVPDVGKMAASLPINPKVLLLPAVPVLALLVVSAPVLMGIIAVTLPVALPILSLLVVLLLALAAASAILYASTHTGRSQLGTACLLPAWQTLLSTPTGQRLVYQTGPRPTPVAAAAAIVPKGQWQRLILSLVLDGLGSASYLLPGVGELVDVVWAPVQTVLILAMYDSVPLGYVSFVEEILPFTDIVPTATVGWLLQFGVPLLKGQQSQSSQSASSKASTGAAVGTRSTVPKLVPASSHILSQQPRTKVM